MTTSYKIKREGDVIFAEIDRTVEIINIQNNSHKDVYKGIKYIIIE